MFVVFLTIILAILAFLANKRSNGETIHRTPSGPWGWPLLGNLVQMVVDPHIKPSQWAEKYGKLYTIHLGNKKTLTVNDPQLVKELFSHATSTGKFKTDTMLLISQGPYGILNTEGKDWSEQRQFFVKTLIKFRFGGLTLEPLILEEVHQVCDWIAKEVNKNDGAVTLNDVFKHATNNALWTIISGERIGLDDHKVVNLLDNFLDGMQLTVKTGLGFFPWLKNIAPTLSGYTVFDKACKDLHKFIGDLFEGHKKTFKDGVTRDVIDSYLEKMKTTHDTCSSFYGELGMANSVSTMVEVFTGGGDTLRRL